jgi:hypothetical protein
MNQNSTAVHSQQISDVRIISNLARQYKNVPKMKPVSLEYDFEFVEKIRHTMLKGERVGQWLQRTNFRISRAEAMAMTRSEIADAVKERSVRPEPGHPSIDEHFRPRPLPKNFLIDELHG